jgi:hypothetical protein
MFQATLTCRACQRAFLVSAEELNQFEVRCPICGLSLREPQLLRRTATARCEIIPWDPSWSKGG